MTQQTVVAIIWSMKTIGERLRDEAARLKGWSTEQTAKEFGVSYETLRKWIKGETAPKRSRAKVIGDLLGRSPEWVMFGLDPMEDAAGGVAPTGRLITEYDDVDELPPGFVNIPRVDVVLSAGNGQTSFHIEEREPLPFQSDYLRNLGAKPSALRAVKVQGDSMERLLFDGDTVLVDTNEKRIQDGGVYALQMDDELKVKRLFRRVGGLLIVSEKKDKFPPLELSASEAESVTIIGRVKYRSGVGDF